MQVAATMLRKKVRRRKATFLPCSRVQPTLRTAGIQRSKGERAGTKLGMPCCCDGALQVRSVRFQLHYRLVIGAFGG